MRNLAPIILFAYNRLAETKKAVEALQANNLARESELFIFSDEGVNEIQKKKVQELRSYLKTISGFKSIHIQEAINNKGLANSVIDGVSQVINTYDKVIVLEDDLVTAPNFLDFMNQALDFYINIDQVLSISGYTMNLNYLDNYDKDFYVALRASSWGWGTWKNRWKEIDWGVSDYEKFKNDSRKRSKFSKIGSDMPRMLKNQMEGKIDSWAIRMCYHQFKYDMVTIFPVKSKLFSIGFGEGATHTSGVLKFETPIDNTDEVNFQFDDDIKKDEKIISQFRAKFSIIRRVMDKVDNVLYKLKK